MSQSWFAVTMSYIILVMYIMIVQVVTSPERNTSSVCLQDTALYSGEVSRNELTSLQECFFGSPSPLTIPSTTDQIQGETDAAILLRGLSLPLLGIDPECEERIRPFLCFHIFGLCDTSNNLRTTLRDTCAELWDSICMREWSIATSLLGPGVKVGTCQIWLMSVQVRNNLRGQYLHERVNSPNNQDSHHMLLSNIWNTSKVKVALPYDRDDYDIDSLAAN